MRSSDPVHPTFFTSIEQDGRNSGQRSNMQNMEMWESAMRSAKGSQPRLACCALVRWITHVSSTSILHLARSNNTVVAEYIRKLTLNRQRKSWNQNTKRLFL
jgi:hypothetical protein